jgi:hypothetical protein
MRNLKPGPSGGRAQRCASLALTAALLGAGPARADFIEIVFPSCCGSPGLDVTENFPPSPVVLDRTLDVTNFATAETIVDSRGIIRTIFTTAPIDVSLGQYTANARISDTARFIGHGTVTFGYDVVGTGVVAQSPLDHPDMASFDIAAASLSLSPFALATDTERFSNLPRPGFTTEFPNETFGVHLRVERTFAVDGTQAAPDQHDFEFLLLVTGSGGASMNLFDTAQGFAILPPGVTMTTNGGFQRSAARPRYRNRPPC